MRNAEGRTWEAAEEEEEEVDVVELRVLVRVGTESAGSDRPMNFRKVSAGPRSCRWKGMVSQSAYICTLGMKSYMRRI